MDEHGLKRKRVGDDSDIQPRRTWIPQPQSVNEPSVNYLVDKNSPKLELLHGPSAELLGIVKTLDSYDHILGHHESLAAHLGAQLISPKLLKALDCLFDGPITVVANQIPNNSRPQPSWTEVIAFAKANPGLFTLTKTPDGSRNCRFAIRNFLCTIQENDWRVIMSGAADQFALVPVQGTPEDEAAELATTEIVEERLGTLISNAERVAEKARLLRHQLAGRKAGIKSRHPTTPQQDASGATGPSIHHGYNLKQDLLDQFLRTDTSPISATIPQVPADHEELISSPYFSASLVPSPTPIHRVMSSKMKSLPKGANVEPPCDLCRKHGHDCVKEGSACEACVKNYIECTWDSTTTDEMSRFLKIPTSTSAFGGVTRLPKN